MSGRWFRYRFAVAGDAEIEAEIDTATDPGWGVRRITKWAIAGLLAVGLIGALIWTRGVPHYRPGLRADETYGLDVSHHQGVVDWQAVASDNIDFVYLKATEGGDHVDTRFAANASSAEAAGLRVGAYHFFTFCRPGAEQAANFLRTAPPAPKWLHPAVDVEFGGNCAARPPEDELLRELQAFIDSVRAAWNRPVVVYVLHGKLSMLER